MEFDLLVLPVSVGPQANESEHVVSDVYAEALIRTFLGLQITVHV